MVYYECYEGNKLIHISTDLNDPDELAEYIKEFPDRNVIQVNKTFYHHIKILESEDGESCLHCKDRGILTVSEENFNKLIRIPHLGCGTGPIKGCYELIVAKCNIEQVLSYGEKRGQLTLLDFGSVDIYTKKRKKTFNNKCISCVQY